MRSIVSPIHIKLLILVVVFLHITPVLLSCNRPLSKVELLFMLVGYLLIYFTFFLDWFITSRKVFRIVEMDENGVIEKSVRGRVIEQYKWGDIIQIHIVCPMNCPAEWLCFTVKPLEQKDFVRILASKKCIIYPMSANAERFVKQHCKVKINKLS